MFFTHTLLFGFFMAIIDALVLSMLRMKHSGDLETMWVFVLAFIVYGCQVFVFYKSLDYAGMVQMNLIWDLSSDLLVTFIGLYFFKESVTIQQKFGIVLGIISILLLK